MADQARTKRPHLVPVTAIVALALFAGLIGGPLIPSSCQEAEAPDSGSAQRLTAYDYVAFKLDSKDQMWGMIHVSDICQRPLSIRAESAD